MRHKILIISIYADQLVVVEGTANITHKQYDYSENSETKHDQRGHQAHTWDQGSEHK